LYEHRDFSAINKYSYTPFLLVTGIPVEVLVLLFEENDTALDENEAFGTIKEHYTLTMS
jgi:hypothetical protein